MKPAEEFELTPFQLQKIREIEEYKKMGYSPLAITCHSTFGSYQYTPEDLRNYHMIHKSKFHIVITRPTKEVQQAS